MSSDKLLPLVTAAIGVISAIVATIQAIRAARITASANIEIERMKADAERRKHALAIASQEVEPVAEALAQAWSDLQALKDFLSLVPRGSLDTRVRGAAAEASDRLASGYKTWGAKLPQSAARAWHDAKNASYIVAQLIDEQPHRRRAAEELQTRSEDIRQVLTEIQTVISVTLATLRDDQVRRLLEILS